jgi:Glycosyltransferase family 87
VVVGLLLASRGHWIASGIALAVGEAVKWTPALAGLALLVWLLAGRRLRDAARFGAGFAAAAVALNLPFLLWNQRNYLNAFHAQGERGITNESIWYFPVRLLGLDDPGRNPAEWAPIGAPHWADRGVVLVQIVLLTGLLVLIALARERLPDALALAALAPVLFLLTNRVFSPQFLVVLAAAWAFAASLVVASRHEQLLVGLLVMTATFANAFVYPFQLPDDSDVWVPYSAAMFVAALLVTGLLLWRASTDSAAARMPATVP